MANLDDLAGAVLDGIGARMLRAGFVWTGIIAALPVLTLGLGAPWLARLQG